LLKSNTLRQWTDEALQSFPRKVLEYIQSSNGVATQPSKTVQPYLNGLIPTLADRHAASVILTKHGVKTTAHYRPEAFLNTVGGSMFYSPKEVQYTPLAGPPQVRNNSVIPTRFGETESHSNVQALACLAAQLVQNKSAQWISNVTPAIYAKVLNNSDLEWPDFIPLSDNFCAILNEDPVWTGMGIVQKSAITGPEMLIFIRSALDRLPAPIYHLMNTRIVIDLLKVYEFDGKDWCQRENENGAPAIASSVYSQKKNIDTESKLMLKNAGYPGCFWYNSGYLPRINFPPNDGTLESARDRYQRSMEFIGGASAPTALLAGMKGYSGMNDDMGKRIQFTVSAALRAWYGARAADIQLYSVGDLPMLFSSLNRWKKYLLQDGCPDTQWEDKSRVGDVKFILPSVNDFSKVHSIYHTEVVYVPRDGTVIVSWADSTLPTAGKKGSIVDYEAHSSTLMPVPWKNHDVIMYSIVYGKYPFQGRAATPRQVLSAAIGTKTRWPKPTYVYAFGTSAQWRGIISTFPDLTLIGYGAMNTGTVQKPVWDERVRSLHAFDLEEVLSPALWYTKIGNDCASQSFAFMAPKSRYHPISNLPSITKTGVQVVITQLEMDDGELFGNVARVGRVKTVPKNKLDLGSVYTDVQDPHYVSPVHVPTVRDTGPARPENTTFIRRGGFSAPKPHVTKPPVVEEQVPFDTEQAPLSPFDDLGNVPYVDNDVGNDDGSGNASDDQDSGSADGTDQDTSEQPSDNEDNVDENLVHTKKKKGKKLVVDFDDQLDRPVDTTEMLLDDA